MAGVAEVDEPLAVETAGHVLQDRDALTVVLDQVVVGREDGGDAALERESKAGNLDGVQIIAIQGLLGRAGIQMREVNVL